MKPSSGLARWTAALVCAAAGGVVFQFFGNANHGYIDTNSLFWWWGFQWWNPDSETQHGWLILGIAAWIWWRNVRGSQEPGVRSQEEGQDSESGIQNPEFRIQNPAARIQRSGSRGCDADGAAPAVAAMIAGLALHAVGFAAQQARVSILGLLLFTWGVVRLGGGRRWGAAAAFPLGFMVFAIPVNVLDSLGFWLRLGVIRATTSIAHTFGIAVAQSGTQLMAPDGRYNYDVAAACSGVRSLMALAALSLLIGYLNFHSWWRRGVMLLLCFPLVYLGNVARISAIVFAAQAGGPKWGDFAHETMGWGIFVIVLGGVLGAAMLLQRFAPEKLRAGAAASRRDDLADKPTSPSDADVQVIKDDRGAAPILRSQIVGPRAALAAVVVLLAGGEALFLHHLSLLPPRGEVGVVLARDGRNPVELPAFLGSDWVGWPAAVTNVEREMLPPDTGYSRMNYVPSRGAHPVFLSIVLSGRDRTSIHRPELCLVGQGWTINGETTHAFTYPGRPDASFPSTVLRVQRRVTTARGSTVVPQLVVYWFVGGDTIVATHWQRLAQDAWNRVVHARADRWAYVLMQTDASDGEPAALARLQAVLDRTLPAFQPPLRGRHVAW